jgi:hypothetical protein
VNAVIDMTKEAVGPFPQAAGWVPRRRRGRKTHVSTLYRWTTSGCRGIVLESLQTPSGRVTSREAIQRFFERLSAGEQPGGGAHTRLSAPGGHDGHSAPALRVRTLTQRERAAEAAGKRLEQMGA